MNNYITLKKVKSFLSFLLNFFVYLNSWGAEILSYTNMNMIDKILAFYY